MENHHFLIGDTSWKRFLFRCHLSFGSALACWLLLAVNCCWLVVSRLMGVALFLLFAICSCFFAVVSCCLLGAVCRFYVVCCISCCLLFVVFHVVCCLLVVVRCLLVVAVTVAVVVFVVPVIPVLSFILSPWLVLLLMLAVCCSKYVLNSHDSTKLLWGELWKHCLQMSSICRLCTKTCLSYQPFRW